MISSTVASGHAIRSGLVDMACVRLCATEAGWRPVAEPGDRIHCVHAFCIYAEFGAHGTTLTFDYLVR